jgi:hypothetical protein
MALPVQVASCFGVLEYLSVGKNESPNLTCIDLFITPLLHYSTTPSLQQTAAKGKDHGSPLRGQFKAGSFGSGFFTQLNYVGIFLILRLVQVLTLFQSWFILSTNPKANGVIRGTKLSKL